MITREMQPAFCNRRAKRRTVGRSFGSPKQMARNFHKRRYESAANVRIVAHGLGSEFVDVLRKSEATRYDLA